MRDSLRAGGTPGRCTGSSLLIHLLPRYLSLYPSITRYPFISLSDRYKSAVTGRGPLEAGWEKDHNVKPRMCAYKVRAWAWGGRHNDA